MMFAWWLAMGLASAQETPEPVSESVASPAAEEAPAEDEGGTETVGDPEAFGEVLDADGQPKYIEVLVIGQQQIAAARDKVVLAMRELGWKAKRKADGRIVFRAPEAWMGKATLLGSGDMEFSVPGLAFMGTRKDQTYDENSNLNNQAMGGSVGASFSIPAGEAKKIRGLQREIYAEVHDDVMAYRETLQRAYFSEMISNLPERLDALWERGEPLGGGATIDDPAVRRAKVLDYWASRTDTPEGRTVSRTVEIWLREVVMTSPFPVTPEEVEAAENRRLDGRRLDLF